MKSITSLKPGLVARLARGVLWAALATQSLVFTNSVRAEEAVTPVLLENAALRVQVGSGGELSVLDKRNGRVWQQTALGTFGEKGRELSSAPQLSGGALSFTLGFDGLPRSGGKRLSVPFEVKIRMEGENELVAEFTPSAEAVAGQWREVRYPMVFVPPPEAGSSLLYPHGTGMLLPANRKNPGFLEPVRGALYGGTRSYLNCVGHVELKSGAGLLAIPLPFESADVYWPDVQHQGSEGVGIQHGWRGNRYQLERPFSLRWQFTAKGGYVAMAKDYRRWCASQGWRKTLREKAAVNPEVDKLIGAPIFWAYGTVPQMTKILEGLRSSGVDRCVLGLDPRSYDCMLEPTPAELSQRRALVENARAAGYLVHHYDNYRDAFERVPKLDAWHQINWDAYPHDMMVREGGALLATHFSAAAKSGVITPDAFLKYAQLHIPKDLERYPFNARFIDCIGSVEFQLEGEDWHPERGQTSMYYVRQKREELMEYSNRMKQVTGTECGMDYLIPYVHWFDGAMHLVAYMDLPPGSFMLQGNDASGAIQGQVAQDDLQLKNGKPFPVAESVRYRIPFWGLVHHDDAMATWRWENGMDKPAEFWTRKLLFNLLYGTTPLFRMDLNEYAKSKEAIAQTHRLTSPWGRRVGYDELLSHRFLTADRLVQDTRFSSGVGICVNFGQKPFKTAEGVEIPGCGYAEFEWQAEALEVKFQSPVAVRIGK